MSIYPNPADDFLNVSYSLNESSVVTFEILDLLGSTIGSPIISTKQQAGENVENVDLSDLPNGTYFLRIKTVDGSIVKKFILAK